MRAAVLGIEDVGAGLLWLACVYMLIAACVHALAVWSVYRIQREGVRGWAMVWPVVWGAWIARGLAAAGGAADV